MEKKQLKPDIKWEVRNQLDIWSYIAKKFQIFLSAIETFQCQAYQNE
jgi:hypothetical protein